ncbi:hypothetical protein Ancab_029525 [Ancistrocladus abbreviatus]
MTQQLSRQRLQLERQNKVTAAAFRIIQASMTPSSESYKSKPPRMFDILPCACSGNKQQQLGPSLPSVYGCHAHLQSTRRKV